MEEKKYTIFPEGAQSTVDDEGKKLLIAICALLAGTVLVVMFFIVH